MTESEVPSDVQADVSSAAASTFSGGPRGGGTDPIAWLVAHEEIRQLASHYAVAVDSRDLDRLVALFVPDVRVGRDRIGHDALREQFERSLGPLGVTILQVGTHAIEIAGDDHATGEVYCHGEVQVDGQWVHQAILYRDTYIRLPDLGWRFVRRIHELWYGVAISPDPFDQPAAEWPRSPVGRGTVPDRWPTWRSFQDRGGSAS